MAASRHTDSSAHTLGSSRRFSVVSNSRRARAAYALSAAALLASAQLTHAADRTWNGGSPNNSWTTALNWIGGVAPAPGDSLTFDGFVTSNNNNIAANTSFAGITFASTAGAFTLSGNAITLSGNVTDN